MGGGVTLNLEKIKAAINATTPGEWYVESSDMLRSEDGGVIAQGNFGHMHVCTRLDFAAPEKPHQQVKADMQFIAESRSVMLALIERCEKLEALVGGYTYDT